jgi:septal ring factor EnvC (AmiA/AmiB activator)
MTIYDIEINIFNKNITMLKQNISDEIIKNDGKIIQEEIQNINAYRIVISMPKNNTANFIVKIKKFGIAVNENMLGNDVAGYFNDMEMRLINIKNMLEKYNKLLQEATDISDKLILEKEINNAEMEIRMMERNTNEMKSRLENNNITILMYNK